jgi:predicted MPP superfamily phosphohydrolase
LRIVQVSDLHIGLVIQKKRLQRLLARVNELHPDVIVSTGDLVDAPIRHSQACLEILQGLRAPQGRFAVLGNHEVDAGLAHAVAFTQAAGFRLLRQETVSVPGWFAISGVDDPATGQGRHAWPSLEDKTLFSILLKHRPVPESESGHFDLQLSGHVHHGQIFPFGLLFRLFHPYYAGLYRLDRFFLYVSRGTGTWGPPVRFLAPPEITLIEVGAAPGKS